MLSIKEIIIVGLALGLIFLLSSVMVLPFLRDTYEYGLGDEPYQRGGTGTTNGYCTSPTSTPIACTSCNVSAGYEFFLENCYSLISTVNGTHCYQCSEFGYRTTYRGLMVIVLLVGIVALIYLFIKKAR